MSMLSRQQAGNFLANLGLRQVDRDIWAGQQWLVGRIFPVFVALREAFVEIEIPLNLVTQCDQILLHRLFNEINRQIAIGKFAIGSEIDHGGRMLVLRADLPVGTDEEYITEESMAILFAVAFKLIEKHFPEIENIFRQGCQISGASSEDQARGILGRLRIFRGSEEEHRA
jgi:hypothetical protein